MESGHAQPFYMTPRRFPSAPRVGADIARDTGDARQPATRAFRCRFQELPHRDYYHADATLPQLRAFHAAEAHFQAKQRIRVRDIGRRIADEFTRPEAVPAGTASRACRLPRTTPQ